MAKARIEAPSEAIRVQGDPARFFIFEALIAWAINGDARFNTNGIGIRASWRIEQELSKLPPVQLEPKEGEPQAPRALVLTQDDQRLLLETLVNPQQMDGHSYPIAPARLLLPYIQAVENAEPIEA